VGKRAGVPVDILHLKIAHHNCGQMPELIGVIQNARNQAWMSRQIFTRTPRPERRLLNIIPPWAHEGGTAEMLKRLRDPSLRARLEHDITQAFQAGTTTTPRSQRLEQDPDRVGLQSGLSQYVGKRVSEMIADKKKPWLDVLFDALVDNRGAIPALYYHTRRGHAVRMKQPLSASGQMARR